MTSATPGEFPSPHRSSTGNWKPFASFVVEFQMRTLDGQKPEQRTKVHHIETDTCAHWSGIENRQICQWMLDQVAESVVKMLPDAIVNEKSI